MSVQYKSPAFTTTNQYIRYGIIVLEKSQNPQANTSKIDVIVVAWRTNQGYTTYGTGESEVWVEGFTYTEEIGRSQVISYNSYTELFRREFTIHHNEDGTKNCYIAAQIEHSQFTTDVNGFSFDLTTIERYAEISQTLASKTETTVSINWTTDAIVDSLWYSTDDGANYTSVAIAEGTSGSYTISGLNASNIYNIKTKVRRKDSQLNSESTALEVTTYDYPYANSMPNFVIGEQLTVGIYNPLGRLITVSMVGNDNTEYGSESISGTSLSGFNSAAWQTWLYSTIPNAQSGAYKIKVVYGQITRTQNGGTYSVNAQNCSPQIGTLTYADTNANTIAVTGDNQKIVRNLSTVLYSATGISGRLSATIVSCVVAVNGQSYSLTLSGTSASGGNAVIDSAMSVAATLTVTDSRGLTSSQSVTVTILDWTLPTAIISLQRKNNFYSETYITVDADFSYLDGENVGTITYKGKKAGDSTYTIQGTLQDNVQSTFTADNNYDWEIVVTLTDIFNATAVYTLHLSRGQPIIYFDRLRSSVGVNCFPQHDNSFEVNGKTIVDLIYPVGSIYLSTGNTSPATLFGGTWTQIEDCFLLAAGQTYSAGSTGGEAAHTLTVNELPEHQHSLLNTDSGGSYGDFTTYGVEESSNLGDTGNVRTSNVGGGQAHNNMPPYLAVYVWQRTA